MKTVNKKNAKTVKRWKKNKPAKKFKINKKNYAN